MKRKLVKTFSMSFAILLFLLVTIVPASASSKEIVVTDKGLIVHENQHIENVIVFGHNATIGGKVNSVILVNGNLRINHSADIKDLVLVIGGNIIQEKGAHVTSNLLSLKWNNQIVSMLIVALVTLAGSWLIKFGLSVFFVIVGLLIALLLGRKLDETQGYIKQINWKMLLIGLATSAVILAIDLILTMTVVGIPFVLILMVPIGYYFFETIAALSMYLGQKCLPDVDSHWLVPLVGVSLVISVLNFPLFGAVILICIYWVSLSLMVMRLRYRFSKNKSST